MSENRNR